jgi:hypothetical protein
MVPDENNGQTRSQEGSSRMTPEEVERWDDIFWAFHDPEVEKKYADEIVAVYRRQILAHGDDRQKVLAEAQRLTGFTREQISLVTVPGPETFFAAH